MPAVGSKIIIKEIEADERKHQRCQILYPCGDDLAVMFGFGLLPPFGQSRLGMKLLGIFIGLVYAWTFTSMIWSSLLAFVAIVWSGAYTIGEFMAVSMGNTTVWFHAVQHDLVASLTQVGLVDYFGKWFISREFLAGRPWLFTWVFLFACFLLGALTNGTAATLIFLSMFFSIAKQVGNQTLFKIRHPSWFLASSLQA